MKKLYYNAPGFEEELRALADSRALRPEIESQVAAIIEDVRKEGDAAIVRYAAKFDHAELDPSRFRVTEEEIDEAEQLLSEREKKAIDTALFQVRDFALATLPRPWSASPRPGVTLGEKFTPMDRGRRLHSGRHGAAGLDRAAHGGDRGGRRGVREIVATTPANREGKVHPAVLYAMRRAGVTEILRLGGVYGVAALALGTESIRRVEKLVGPGNAYVTAAKKLLYGRVAIDMVAGPSEILVIADAHANPEFIAADLLSQAEHGSGLEQAVLVTTDRAMIERVEAAFRRQKATLPAPRDDRARGGARSVPDPRRRSRTGRPHREHLRAGAPRNPDGESGGGRGKDHRRGRDLPRTVDAGTDRRLLRRAVARAADRLERPLLQRA